MTYKVVFYGPLSNVIEARSFIGPVDRARKIVLAPPDGASSGALFQEVDLCCGLKDYTEVWRLDY